MNVLSTRRRLYLNIVLHEISLRPLTGPLPPRRRVYVECTVPPQHTAARGWRPRSHSEKILETVRQAREVVQATSVDIRASKEGSQIFYKHGKGPY